MSRGEPTADLPAVPAKAPPRREQIAPDQYREWHTEERHYELITPLFGGGVATHTADPVTVVRGSSIRGQLRFWWRACRAGHYANSKTMKAAEDLLWGAASIKGHPRPSQVQIAVNILKPGQPLTVKDNKGTVVAIGSPKSPYGYVAFPLQEDGGVVQENVAFRLSIMWPMEWAPGSAAHFAGTPHDEVAAALWAWETFGGIGGRTRRGFGALRRRDAAAAPPSTPKVVLQWLGEQLSKHIVTGPSPEDVPYLAAKGVFQVTLAATHHVGVPPATGVPPGVWRYFVVTSDAWAGGMVAWKYLIDRLRDFRQRRTNGRFGISLWPEPDAIRRLTGAGRVRATAPLDKFPRAAFGLPIIFHFKDFGDPPETSLQGTPPPIPATTAAESVREQAKGYDRLASPLILRPLVCADGKPVALAVVLKAPRTPPQGLMLEETKKEGAANRTKRKWQAIDAALLSTEAAQLPMMNGQTDVIQAFLRTLV